MSIFDILRVRTAEGYQAIRDPRRQAVDPRFRGIPLLDQAACSLSESCSGVHECVRVCPAAAIGFEPLSIDLGRCVLCGDCATACPVGAIGFSGEHRMATSTREGLIVKSGERIEDWPARLEPAGREIRTILGRSLKLRSVSAGGCNGCELELNAAHNVNFDIARYGIEVVASPRHADALVLTGPVTRNMAPALRDVWAMMPGPKLLIAAGACAISGGVFAGSPELDRSFLEEHTPDLYLPGCPVHPLTIVNGILGLLGRTKAGILSL